MAWGAIAGIAISAVQGAKAKRDADKAGGSAQDRAKRAGKANYGLIMAEMTEETRRTKAMNRDARFKFKSTIGASGVKNTGTAFKSYTDLVDEQDRQLDWTRRAGISRANAAKEQGSYIGGQAMSQAKAQGNAAMYNGLGNAATIAINEWG